MSQLPARPNLEHLKKQAKRLLHAWKLNEAGALHRAERWLTKSAQQPRPATLADAQFIIAREHGFASWPKLKIHVQAVSINSTSITASTARQQAIRALAESLTTWARGQQGRALGARFAALPLRDILAVRSRLAETNQLNEVVDGLLAGLEHDQARVRFDCANALDHLADDRCAPALRRLLSDPVPRVRRAALHALSCEACKLGPAAPGEVVAARLRELAQHDPSVRVRRAAVQLLSTPPNDDAADLLHGLAHDADPTIRRTAQAALRRAANAKTKGESAGQPD